MKLYYTTLMAVLVSSVAFNQDFKTSAASATIYEASIYRKSTKSAVITSEGYFIHENDAFEVINLKTGETVLKHDFEGGTGQTWIDPKGRYVGNYSQNGLQLESGWTDAVCVYDLKAGKIYTKPLDIGYWNKGVFHPQKSQMLVNEYNAVEGGARALLYDFVEEKEVKTYFSTKKFSTVVMAMAFSPDGSKIYAGIAPNGYTSYINVYDTESGEVLKKISFKYNLDKIIVTDDYIFCSGTDGDSGKGFTSVINPNSYEVKTWDNIKLENVHPSGKICYGVEYESNTLSEYDLTTGKKTDLFDVSGLGNFDYAYSSGFSSDGKYFFMSRRRPKETPNKALVLFKNELMEEDVHIYEPYNDGNPDVLETVYNYTSSEPKFSIDFESKPEVKEEKTKSGAKKITLKQSPSKQVVYMVLVAEMSSKIKEAKYNKTAEDIGKKFIENMEVSSTEMSTMDIDGMIASQHTFTKKGIFYRYVSVCIDGYTYQLIFLNSGKDGNTGEDFVKSFTTK